MNKDALLIYSGGMDSTTLLYERKNEIALALSFDYGSKHNAAELRCAQWHCEHLSIEHLVIDLAFIGQYFHSSLLKGGNAIPHGEYNDDNMHSTVVPFRNGIMLSVAAGMAESRGLRRVMMANHFGDHTIYPDCRRSFVDAMDAAIAAGTYQGIRLDCPYTDISKTEIALRGKVLGIDYSRTWSCYEGGEQQCGTCATCHERREALREAGIDDTTPYLQ